MTIRNLSIFRAKALRRYAEKRAESVLPPWTSPLFHHLHPNRVPVILQMSAVECGAACLAMILGYFGRKTRLAECREKCDVGRDGVTAQTLVAAARAFGLRPRAYSLDSADLRRVPMPAIAHWDFNHFVVVEHWSPRHTHIVDPTSGRRRLSAQEFDSGFTGVVLTFEPGINFEPHRETGPSMVRNYGKRILRVPGAGSLLTQILAVSLVLQVFGFTLPLFTKILVDRVLTLRIAGSLSILGFAGIVVVATQAALGYLRSTLLIFLGARLDSNMMLGFFEHLLALPFRFFQQRNSGDLLMRLGSNATIREALASHTISAILDGTLVLVYIATLLQMAPRFGAAVLAIGVAEVAILLASKRKLHRLLKSDLSSQAESQSYLIEALRGIETLKASGAEDRALTHWSNLFSKQLNSSVQRTRFSETIESAMLGIRTLSPLCLLWLGGIEVLSGSMSLGTMLALNALASAFLMPLASLVSSAQRLQLAGAHLQRIADVMQAEPEQDPAGAENAPKLTGHIELRNVSFRYDSHAPLVLRNISLSIESGQKVALVGRTGSGKSTLAKLLLGLYLTTEGDVLYDSHPLQSLSCRLLRGQWGVVLQDSFVFSGSIRQNIAFHDRGITIDEVMEAARVAAIHGEIALMPMGYETMLDEGGAGLSGGQRQRLSIARAVVRKPPFLLLDEATSHLDVLTEGLVDQNLDNLSCTRVVIAHRMSTIRNADKIVVLDGGSIVEQGSHDELVARGGHYVALICNQFQAQLET